MDKLIVQPKGGLGNRLRVIFSYFIICLQNNKKLIINWKNDKYCSQHFLDVFLPIKEIYFSNEKPQIVTSRKIKVNNELYKKSLKLLIPKNISELKEKIKEWEEYSAIHIRRTDHIQLAKKNNKFVDLQYFENFIKNKQKCFLATDCEKTQKYLIKKYPQIIVWENIKSNNKLRQTTLKNSISDMWCCIHAKQFLGTPFSSFSDLIYLLNDSQI